MFNLFLILKINQDLWEKLSNIQNTKYTKLIIMSQSKYISCIILRNLIKTEFCASSFGFFLEYLTTKQYPKCYFLIEYGQNIGIHEFDCDKVSVCLHNHLMSIVYQTMRPVKQFPEFCNKMFSLFSPRKQGPIGLLMTVLDSAHQEDSV